MSKVTISKPIEMDQYEEVIKRVPAREEIEQRAYTLFLARGAGDGHDREDWIQAERELQEGDDSIDEGAAEQHSPHRRR